ncbi:aldehyde ferredoxin oxidoreductase family protein [Desulfoscipio geothermicus]|uniref:Aldehyde:ferredoxin oxidoreductase n=1 Tax=Desulfoscipio geothermicus DSM 3669 TaxID=1121426 RepID=A0A1I6D189_9FIRM|nr:aldehyde ferredoxin oxidoreductase family protein [Desulfoscipio geothermicus]SFQ99245.1 aldehyde:ferredoxin oxidoreductase [Desulfoscipio geothermicus DSM 3669]
MTAIFGYAGKILDIDLSTHSIKTYLPDGESNRKYLSGVGFNAKVLYEELPAGADPLGPENILVFHVGALVGTNVPTASRSEVSAKSPATGLFGTANSGNYWGSELKYAGYDGIVIRGRAAHPVYILVTNDNVRIIPAGHLWGRDAWETIAALRAELRDRDMQVASIGPAGENLVRFASIENGPFDAWARTGLGAVMGSKNLKAVAVRGTGHVRVARRREFMEKVAATRKAIYASPFYGPFERFGTMLVTLPYQEFGILPGRNFQTGIVDGWVESRSRKQVSRYSNRGVACIACPIACAHWVEIKDGPYKGLKVKDMEVTPVIGFGAGCDINNLPAIARITEICQRLGLDMVSAASAVALAMELYEKGTISEGDLGYPLPWGSEEQTFKLLHDIAHRQGIGDTLAEGTRRASDRITGSDKNVPHVKGLECFLIDPRGRWSTWTLGYITNIRGGDHLRTRNPVENLRYNDNPTPYRTEKFAFPEAMYHNLDMPEALKKEIFDPTTRDVDIPKMSKWSEDLISLYNATGMCIRPPVLHTVGPTLIAGLYSALTGIDITPEDAIQAGERTWNLQKLFNIKHGEKPAYSDYPARFYEEPVGAGPQKGRKLDRTKVRETLADYYRARGWDPQTGKPTPQKLAELKLDDLF